MKAHRDRLMHSSEFPDWGTPDPMVKALRAQFPFVLDVAASDENKKAPNYYGLDHVWSDWRDGLARDWHADAWESVTDYAGGPLWAFMNPPYSREQGIRIEPWIAKAYEESLKGLGVVAVIPASTQTRWWQKWVRKAHEIRDIPHRVNFEASASTLAAINAKRAAANPPKPPVDQAWNAGGNTAVVIWWHVPGYVGHVEPIRRYWTYRPPVDQGKCMGDPDRDPVESEAA
jgi:phage N-6-adenine-methyltransferase